MPRTTNNPKQDKIANIREKMSNRIIEGMEELFNTWEPREKFVILKDTDYDKHYKRTLKHALVY